jgi:Fe-S-cluster containining protein
MELSEGKAPADPCGTCGVCCRSYMVPLCGRDVWQISIRLRMAPEQFVFAYREDAPTADAFYLDPAGAAYSLCLDKRGKRSGFDWQAQSPCIFLLELQGGHCRCGIYAHRPMVCRDYPMRAVAGGVAVRDDVLCPPNSWSPAMLRRPSWSIALQRRRMHFDIYRVVVARWNAHLTAGNANRTENLDGYLGYLLNVYERLDALEREYGEARVGEVEREWGNDQPESGEPPSDDDLAAWLIYAGTVRAIVNAFYPAVPPLSCQT